MLTRVARLISLFTLAFALNPPARAQRVGPAASEYGVKAAFLLNFARFVEWPASAFSPDAAFEICVLGKDPFGGLLDQVAEGETVAGRKIVVRRISRLSSSQSCQTLFIGSGNGDPLARTSLVVGEGREAFKSGAMVAFLLENGRVRFDIDQRAAENAGLKISSSLLNVARTVIR